MRKFSFEKLEVWHLSKEVYKKIYFLTKDFPEDEKYGIVSQMRRSAMSVTSNIAEGSSRRSKKDKIRFIEIAYGSLLETLSILIITNEIKLTSDQFYKTLRKDIEEVGNKLNALRIAFK